MASRRRPPARRPALGEGRPRRGSARATATRGARLSLPAARRPALSPPPPLPPPQLAGQTVVLYNRSEVVGRPLAAMLANDGALVYSVDIDNMLIYRKGRVNGTIKARGREGRGGRAAEEGRGGP